MYPYLIDKALAQAKRMDLINTETKSTVHLLKDEVCGQILRMVRCHLGLDSPISETYPQSIEEMIVHLADKIASRVHWIIDGDEIDFSRWID